MVFKSKGYNSVGLYLVIERQLTMRRQWGNCNLSYSTLTEGFRQPQPYSQTTLPYRMAGQSKEKSLQRSKDRKIASYQQLGKTIRSNTYKGPESVSLREVPNYDFKESPSQKDMEAVVRRVRELQARMLESQHRVQALQVSNKNTTQLRSALEDFMRNHYAEIQDRQAVKDRMATFEEALGHLSSLKADKKQLQNIEIGRYYGLTQRCNELQRQGEQINIDILELKSKFQRTIDKLQPTFQSMNQKYIELFQSNVIKTVDHVNRFTEQFQNEIKGLHQKYSTISLKIQEMQKSKSQLFEKQNLRNSFARDLIGISLPNVKLVQSLIVREQRKARSGLNGFKEHIKQQHKEAVPLSESGGSASTYSSQTLLNTIYDSLDGNQTNEIQFQKIVYKLDKDFNLLDQNDHYLMNANNQHIKLNMAQISLLKEQGIFA